MKTKIIQLSIFFLLTTHVSISSSCDIQTSTKTHNQTLFVFLHDPNFIELEKLSYIFNKISCLIPMDANFQYRSLGDKIDPKVDENAVLSDMNQPRRRIRQTLSSTPATLLDFCAVFAADVEDRIYVGKNVQLIGAMYKKQSCPFMKKYEQLRESGIIGDNFHMNVILLDDSQSTIYNSILIPIDSISPSGDLPIDLSNNMQPFVDNILKSVENPQPDPHPPKNHDHGHNNDEALEPWMIIVIIIIILILLIAMGVGICYINNKKNKRATSQSTSGSGSAEDDKPIIMKKVAKAPLRPNPIPPTEQSGSMEKTNQPPSKEKSGKTKSTLSYSITLESVKSKKKKSTGSKGSGSKETVSSGSVEPIEKAKVKKVMVPAKNVKGAAKVNVKDQKKTNNKLMK